MKVEVANVYVLRMHGVEIILNQVVRDELLEKDFIEADEIQELSGSIYYHKKQNK